MCYIVYIGRIPGVYERWQDCHMQVNGFPGNRYKGYMSRAAAEGTTLGSTTGRGTSS